MRCYSSGTMSARYLLSAQTRERCSGAWMPAASVEQVLLKAVRDAAVVRSLASLPDRRAGSRGPGWRRRRACKTAPRWKPLCTYPEMESGIQ
jgi:hypothetical protein